MLAALEWHILWQRIFHPDHVFVLALWRTIYISVLAQTLGVVEIRYSTTFKPVEYFLAVAFWYLVLTTVWSLIQAQIERRLAVSERGDELSFRERFFEAWAPVAAW